MHYFRLINCLINARLLQVLQVLRVNILHQQQQKLNTLCPKLRRTDGQIERQADRRTHRQIDRVTAWTSVLLLTSTRARDILITSAHCVARVAQKIKDKVNDRQTCLNTLLFILFVCFLLLLCFFVYYFCKLFSLGRVEIAFFKLIAENSFRLWEAN